MKKLTALLCLSSLLIQMLTAQTSPVLKKNIKTEYGLESDRSYSSDEVAELLAIAEEEAEVSIKEAYAEGYKAGVLEYAPENARLEALNKSLEKDAMKMQASIEMQKTFSRYLPVIFAAGILSSFAGGYAVRGAAWK